MEYDTQILSILKQHGLRRTKTRQAVLGLFLGTHTPLSAERILRALAKMCLRVNKTTVYRELEKLAAAGLLQSVQLQDRKQYYELATRGHHHHFVCVECDEVEDVRFDEGDLAKQEALLSRKKEFSVFSHSLEFFGLCKMCSS